MLQVAHLTKEFTYYRHPWERLLSAVGRRRADTLLALDHVSFDVPDGTALGIIGANGAGKSSLLRILAGTLYATSGGVHVTGRVASMLQLGVGFHPELTGRQNVSMNARLLGLADNEIRARMRAITAFAEIGDFVDRPLRTYSSGMQLRLGFAVAVNIDAEVLLIDEVLAVGDAYFQQKCMRRLQALRDNGAAIVLVSHDLAAIRSLCDRALLLHAGRVIAQGRPDAVVEQYMTLLGSRTAPTQAVGMGGPPSDGLTNNVREASITAIDLLDGRGRRTAAIAPGAAVQIRLTVSFAAPLVRPTVGILIRDRLGNDAFGTNTYHHGIDTGVYEAGQCETFSFFLQLDLGPGEYTVTAAVHRDESHTGACFHWLARGLVFQVLPLTDAPFVGTAFLRPRIAVGTPQSE